MKENLIEFPEVMALLGYEDERSAVKWCHRNDIRILKLGAKKYTSKHLLTQVIDNQLLIFDAEEIGPLKRERKKKTKFQPKNEIMSKYLAKYESNNKSKAA